MQILRKLIKIGSAALEIRAPLLDEGRGAFQMVSISAPRAGLADALSTAACLMDDRAQVAKLVAPFPGCRIEALSA